MPQAGGPLGDDEAPSVSKKGESGDLDDARMEYSCTTRRKFHPQRQLSQTMPDRRGFARCPFAGCRFTGRAFNGLHLARGNYEKRGNTVPGAAAASQMGRLPRSIPEGGGSLRPETGAQIGASSALHTRNRTVLSRCERQVQPVRSGYV